MIIQAGFADRDDPRTFRQLAQRRDHIVPRFLHISRMNADDGENIRIFLRQLDRAPAAFNRRADRDDARDAGFGRALQDVVEVRREIRVIEMRVSFDQHCRVEDCRFHDWLQIHQICNSAMLTAALRYHSITVLAQVSPPPKTTIRT